MCYWRCFVALLLAIWPAVKLKITVLYYLSIDTTSDYLKLAYLPILRFICYLYTNSARNFLEYLTGQLIHRFMYPILNPAFLLWIHTQCLNNKSTHADPCE